MATRHTISRADTLFSGGAYYPRAFQFPGLPVHVFNSKTYGAIALAVANNVAASQASAGVTNALTINGALATAGVATLDVARNIVAAWTGAAIITVTGTDQYGETLTEVSASGTAFTGKKAFFKVTAVTFNAAVTAATVGTGVVIGLPYRVDANGLIKASQTNTNDAATFVPADTTSPATSATGDTRGTVTFASAPDGTKTYKVYFDIADRTGGADKRTGAYGVPQA